MKKTLEDFGKIILKGDLFTDDQRKHILRNTHTTALFLELLDKITHIYESLFHNEFKSSNMWDVETSSYDLGLIIQASNKLDYETKAKIFRGAIDFLLEDY